ncbi:MAG: dihydroneopterin aldolase [Bacteroidetes bacterium]|nr:dihydroneopterin aldolase [Bacteroidota bacterium]
MSEEKIVMVELKHLRFYAFHGVYAEELKAGNEFEVDAKISFKTNTNLITHLHDTVNYARVYTIIRTLMEHHEPLLETVAMKIADEIHKEFPFIHSTEIRIVKLYPPIINFTGQVGVTYVKQCGD